MAEIRLEKVGKSFNKGKVKAVNDITLMVEDGEFMVLLGPSGCGKTTLLRSVAGLEYLDTGQVHIGERDVTYDPPRRRNVSMVFQNYAIFPHLTVRDNIAFGLRMKNRDRNEMKQKVEQAAELVELSDFLDRYPAQLSGGQQQRVSVARAIAVEPAVLLMDEPLSNLDALLRLNFRSDLKRLVGELRTTTIYVTHDQIEALSLGDRIAVMREGKVVQLGTPMQIYENPATQFVGGFIGNPPMNFLTTRLHRSNGHVSARVGDHGFEAPSYLIEQGDRDVVAGIRAENIRVTTEASESRLPAVVEVIEPLGSQVLVTVSAEKSVLKVLADNDFQAEIGGRLWLEPVPERVRWFDPDSASEISRST